MRPSSRLAELLSTLPSVMVGYSGGVDSALVAVVARRVMGRDRSMAAIGVSASYPGEQHRQAIDLARTFDLNLVELRTDELTDPRYLANAPSRCYFCKTELWSKLATLAAERGVATVVDGTNADDLNDHRPGLRAAAEWGIRSPLAELGYTKAAVRDEARALAIPVWDAPASPCLSSRVMYGLSITPERLDQVERGEQFLRELGIRGDLRVRHRGSEARIEVTPAEFDRIRGRRSEVGEVFLSLGFARVALDLGGYRRGKLLEKGDPDLELLAERV